MTIDHEKSLAQCLSIQNCVVDSVGDLLGVVMRPKSLAVLARAIDGPVPSIKLASAAKVTVASVEAICVELLRVGVLRQKGGGWVADMQELVARLPFGNP